jgi:hypothetical protein
MNNPQHPPSKLSHVPAILAGSAALIAAISTLYVNLRGEAKPEPDIVPFETPAVEAAPAAAAPAVAAPQTAAGPTRMLVRLDRIQVDNDGSMGTTDWSFQVNADGQPLYSVSMPALNDKPGHNLARPKDAQQASAEVEVPSNKSMSITVNAWKKRLLPGTPAELSGKAWLQPGLNKTVVTLGEDAAKGPHFVLYFAVTPAP